MKLNLLLITITLLSLTCFGQTTNKIVTIVNKFDQNEVTWFKKSGTGSIKGTAKFKSKNGTIRFGSEFRIELQPFSAYSQERLFNIYKSDKEGHVFIEDGVPKFIPDPKGYHDTKKAMCNNKGEFEFLNLPPGDYYIIAFMLWDKTGGGLMQRVQITEGEAKVVEMTNF